MRGGKEERKTLVRPVQRSPKSMRPVKTSPETQTWGCSFTLSKIENLEEINDKQKTWPVVPQGRGPLVG